MNGDVMALRQLVFTSQKACRELIASRSEAELLAALDDANSLSFALRAARLIRAEIERLIDQIPRRDFIPATLNDAETARMMATY